MNDASSFFTAAPTLRSERLTLRAHRADDLDASFALWSDPDVVRYITGKPATRAEAWTRLLRYAGLWRLLGFGYWAVEETASGRFVGDVGFADFKREIEPSLEGMAEMGWVLSPAFHGRGYASEAVATALAWLDANRPDKTAACIISPDNPASLRVAAKHDFKESARSRYMDSETIQFRRTRQAALRAGAVDASTRKKLTR